MAETEIKQRLELRYRVYQITLILFWVEELQHHLGELFGLLRETSRGRKLKRLCEVKTFKAKCNCLASEGWLTADQQTLAIDAYGMRNDVAHEMFKMLGTVAWRPGDLGKLAGARTKEIGIAEPVEFDYFAAGSARKAAYCIRGLVAARRGDGDLAACFTRQSVPFSPIDEIIEAELVQIDREWDEAP